MRSQSPSSTKPLWLAIGILAVLVLWNPFSPTPVSETTNESSQPPPDLVDAERLQERIETLESELQQELMARFDLEQRVGRLENQGIDGTVQTPIPEHGNGSSGRTQARGQTNRDPNTEVEVESASTATATLEDKLIESGLPEETVFAIKNTIDRNRLEMLELRDSAIRDGWQDTPEFVEQMHELRDASRGLRDEVGDRVYDQYLYASGQPNRIVVRDVYQGSAAQNAGIQAGDIITGYATSRMFSMSDLRQATVEGIAGESVLVEIQRDGEPVITSILRGPMGISMNATSLPPPEQ